MVWRKNEMQQNVNGFSCFYIEIDYSNLSYLATHKISAKRALHIRES